MEAKILEFTPLKGGIKNWVALFDVKLNGKLIRNFIVLKKNEKLLIQKPLACKEDFDVSVKQEIGRIVYKILSKLKVSDAVPTNVKQKRTHHKKRNINFHPNGYYTSRRIIEADQDHQRMEEVRENIVKEPLFSRVKEKKDANEKNDTKGLSDKEKIEISRQHQDLACSWVDDRGIKAMRGARYSDMKKRSRGE